MTWILYIIFGSSMPTLSQTAMYTTEPTCQIAQKALEAQRVRAVCLPREASK